MDTPLAGRAGFQGNTEDLIRTDKAPAFSFRIKETYLYPGIEGAETTEQSSENSG